MGFVAIVAKVRYWTAALKAKPAFVRLPEAAYSIRRLKTGHYVSLFSASGLPVFR
jgi:hypothetical protein